MMEMLKGQFESVTTPLGHYVHNFPKAFNYWLLFAQINDGIMSDHDLLGGVTYIKMPSTFFIAFKKSIISEYETQEEIVFLKIQLMEKTCKIISNHKKSIQFSKVTF